MPLCEGLPGGPCPLKKNDGTVVIGKGDLMLCLSCDTEGRRLFDEANKSKAGKNPASRARSTSNSTVADSAQSSRVGGMPVASTGRRAQTPAGSAPVQLAAATSLSTSDLNENTGYATATASGDTVIIVNELLSYTQFYRDRASFEALHKVIVGYFHPIEIADAKKLLDLFSELLADCPLTVSRRQSSTCAAHDAEAKDIIRILEILDDQGNVQFAVVALDRLPKYNPEEVNLCAVIDKQQQLDGKVDGLTRKLAPVSDSSVVSETMKRVEDCFTVMTSKLREQMDQLTAACVKMTATCNTARSAAQSSDTVHNEIDRSRNVVITGVNESREQSEWRGVVSRVISTAAGREVRLDDAFRLGRFVEGKKRPILVKLNSAWDRRLVLSGARKLSGVDEFRRRVFISADEPPEVRRRNTFDRLKAKAERQGQVVSVSSDGILSIDGVATFCMQQGFINRQPYDNVNRDG